MQQPDAWNRRAAMEPLIKELGELQALIEAYEKASAQVTEMEKEPDRIDEKTLGQTEKIIRELEIKRLFGGTWDKNDAIVSIHAGAGGQDAADWVHMLYLMYKAYADKNKWKTTVIDSTEESQEARTGRVPLKNITFEVKGSYAFGYLKKESGVHRLVRVSPFSAQSLRHTSFALVEVMPAIQEHTLQIKDEDLKVGFFRSSGPGGQNVNKVETAVRIVHIPTGTVTASQVERSQSQNRARAMAILEAKLIQLMEKERVQELDKLRTKTKPEWGSQIRSYVLNPYKLVKDHRTDYETTQVDGVLQKGDLDGFIETELTQETKKP
jgi:peptide chain release factor 2